MTARRTTNQRLADRFLRSETTKSRRHNNNTLRNAAPEMLRALEEVREDLAADDYVSEATLKLVRNAINKATT